MECQSCRHRLETEEDRHVHYRGQWHRYNVKRKCKGLPPASEDTFEKMLSAAMSTPEKVSNVYICSVCSVKYQSKHALENHFNSLKHKKAAAVVVKESEEELYQVVPAARVEEDLPQEEEDEEEPFPIPVGDCLFCTHASFEDADACITHMKQEHCFFVPYLENLTNSAGLLEYLGFKIGVGLLCIACEGLEKPFRSLQAVRNHMIDKGHCRIKGDITSEEFELDAFYEFEECETDRYPVAINSNGELVLSDGTLLGSRELFHVYRQNVREDTEVRHQQILAIRSGETKEEFRGTLISGSFAQIQRARAGRMPLDAQRAKNQHQSKQDLDVSVRANKLKKHFRKQMLV